VLQKFLLLLADRTDGRAYATTVSLSDTLSVNYVLWLNGASSSSFSILMHIPQTCMKCWKQPINPSSTDR